MSNIVFVDANGSSLVQAGLLGAQWSKFVNIDVAPGLNCIFGVRSPRGDIAPHAPGPHSALTRGKRPIAFLESMALF